MIDGIRLRMRKAIVHSFCIALTATGCAFQGVTSLPLPGAVGRGPHGKLYHVEVSNVGTLEPNSPVLINDVVVGSVGKIRARNWHAEVEVYVKPDVAVPANAVAAVGQTSLLGSLHLELDPAPGQPPRGQLGAGATIPLSKSSTYPSTEQTLSSLSALVNGGGLGQIGDIIHNSNIALSGRESQVRDLLSRLDTFVGVLDQQRDNIVASIQALNRMSATFAGQRDVLTRALRRIPPALNVLIKERPRITTALEKLGSFSDTTTKLVNDTQADLVKNLQNLEPTLRALADIGPNLGAAITEALTFPFTQDFIDRAVKGDYMNLWVILDFTIPRLKRTLLLGTRWGQTQAKLVPAPGDPAYLNFTYDSPGVPLPPAAASPAAAAHPDSAPLPAAPAPWAQPPPGSHQPIPGKDQFPPMDEPGP
ncbi:MCE family protein [Mycobacterium paraffinicum]|uniref:MCE family protein n=1 Tax=Mycobacterium paraffinicum TaxID=53378 RepID=A0ABP8F2S1_9MYCO|nr:MCE family protein [Mycobacterium paraffinicum]